MRAYCCKVLLCATALILVSPAADARYWRYYGYHWYGRSWNGSSSTSDERQVEKRPLGAEPGNDPRQVGDFGAAIEQMNHACDRQVAELKDMPLDAVARVVDPTPDQRDALDLGRVKTKSDLVVMPSRRQIFAFFCSPRDRRAQN